MMSPRTLTRSPRGVFSTLTATGCLASLRSRLGLWWDKSQVLLQQAFTLDNSVLDPIDASAFEPQILYSASPVMAISECSEASACPISTALLQPAIAPVTDLIVIDARIARIDQLIADLQTAEVGNHRTEVLTLDRNQNAIDQISSRLKQLDHVASIQIFSHGNDGQLVLGNSIMDASNIASYASSFSSWQPLVDQDADLLIYSCNVAATQRGTDMLQQLSQWTGMDIAASRDLTGSASIAANWDLEFTIGSIESRNWMSESLKSNWTELLPTIQVTTQVDRVDGNTASIASLLASPGADQSISLREAILAANASAGSDVIVLAEGVYQLTIVGANENHADTGDLNITDDIELMGAGIQSTFIDGLNADRLFTIDNQATVTMSNLTLTAGTAPSNRDGGAIWLTNNSSLTLDHVRIHQSTAFAGGAIYVDQSSLTLTHSQLDHNQAVKGGAIYNRNGIVNISDSTLALNDATQRGGGIYVDNSSGLGLQLANATLSANTANIQGGAIYTKGNVAINQATIAFNQAATGGGIAVANGNVTIQNSILANNQGGSVNGTMQSLGNNLSDQSIVGLSQPSDLVGNAALLPLGNYGGDLWTHLLSADSDAIDAAAPDVATLYDQRGLSRDASPDIGAIEYQRLAATSDLLINTTTSNEQLSFADGTASGLVPRSSQQSVAMSADGSYVVVWSSYSQDSSGWSVVARKFSASGIALTGELQVNQFTSGDQKWARVAVDSQGNFVVTWTSVGQDGTPSSVYARRFDSQGNALGNEFRVNAANVGSQRNSVIALDWQSSAFVIAFESDVTGSDTNIVFRRFDADGNALDAGDVQANSVDRGQELDATITTLATGQFVIAWTVNQQLYLQRFSQSGATAGSEVTVQANASAATTPVVASDSAGSYAVGWQDTTNGVTSILAKLFYADGTLKQNIIALTSGQVSNPSIAMSADGSFVAAWQRDAGATGFDIFATRFDEYGSRVGNETVVNQVTAGVQYLPAVASLDSSQYVVIWSGEGNGDSSGIYARQFGSAIGANQPPIAIVQGNLSIVEGDSLILDASGSLDPDGSLVSYEWDLDQDGNTDFTGASLNLSWAQLQSYGIQTSSALPYTVSLRVVDNQGWSNTTQASVTVSDTPPSITVTGSGSVVQQNDYNLSFTAVDPGVETVSNWIVQWGDGQSDQLSAVSSSATHRYTTTGNYSILVQLQDSDGTHDASIHQVTVVAGNAAPTAVDDLFSIAQGGSISGAAVTQWFDDSWIYRRLLQVPLVDNSVSLTDHPILIRLHASASDAIQVDYSQFAAGGNDLRFVDLSGNQLAYQIETWNPNGYSSIWVNIPLLQTVNDQNQFYMYYGNSGAPAGETPTAVWNSQYVGVYHLNANTTDSTDNGLDGTGTSLVNFNGQVAGGKLFNGSSSTLDLGSAPELDNLFDGGGTVSAWVYLLGWGENGFGRILDKSDSTGADNGFAFQVAQTAGTDGQLIFEQGFSGTVGRWRTAAGSMSLFQWHFVTLVYDNSSAANAPSIYIDGVQQTLTVSSTPAGSRQSDETSSMTIGNRDDATDRTFFGVIDEVRLSQAMESSQWVMESYRSIKSAPVSQLELTEHPQSVRSNDFDLEQDPLLVSLVTGPTHASSFTLTSAGTFSYQHNGDYATTDSFVYRVTDAHGGNSTATATIQIASVNTPPTISVISDQAINEDEVAGPISFIVGDTEQPASSLMISAQSSDQTIVLNNGISLSGSGANRSLLITPVANAFGTTVISVTVSDGLASTTRNFNVVVSAVNDAPMVTPILDQTIAEDSGTRAVAFSIDDIETNADALVVSASSSNASVITNSQVILSGTGAQRQLLFSLNLNASGSTVVTVTVSDGVLQSSMSFTVTVTAVNDAPQISAISDQTISEGQTPSPIAFTVSDIDSLIGSLTVQVQSSNSQLVAPADLIISGSGGQRTLSWTPQAGVFGSSVVTVTVGDGSLTTNESFLLTVNQNTAPTVATVSSISLDEDQLPAPISIAVQDAETASGALIVSAHSSNPALIADQSIQFGGSGANRTINWTPNANANGTAVITISVSDGIDTTTTGLSVTVNPVNDAPLANDDTIKQLGAQDILISISTLLDNDSDLDGDPLQWFLDTQPSHGRLELVSGTLKYAQTEFGFSSDSFSYRVFDGTSWSNSAAVQLQLDANAFAGFISLSMTPGGAASNLSSLSNSSASAGDSADAQTATSSATRNDATSQSDSTTAGAVLDMASQVSMAMLAQSTAHTQPHGNLLGSEQLFMSLDNDALARMTEGTRAIELHESGTTQRTLDFVPGQAGNEWSNSSEMNLQSGWLSSSSTATLQGPAFWERIGDMRQELRSSFTLQSSFSVGTAATTTAGMTVGYVAWVMRSGLLFSSMMTQLPIWRFMDPLTILDSPESSDLDSDDETINSMVDGDWEVSEPADDEPPVQV